jgi:hypothetical protein
MTSTFRHYKQSRPPYARGTTKQVLLTISFMSVGLAQSWVDLPGRTLQSVTPANATSCNQSGTSYATSCDVAGDAYGYLNYGKSVVSAWGSAASVTKAGDEKMLIMGGGHSDYGGDQIYAINLAGGANTISVVFGPSHITTADYDNCSATNDNGTPRSAHMFANLVYMPNVHKVFRYGGGVYCGNGQNFGDTWLLDPDAYTWAHQDPVACPTPCGTSVGGYESNYTGSAVGNESPDNYAAYDPNTGTVFVLVAERAVMQYTPCTGSNPNVCNTYIRAANIAGLNGGCYSTYGCPNAFVDSKRKFFWVFGAGNALRLDISKATGVGTGTYPLPYVNELSNIDSSCNTLLNAQGPGLYYDAGRDVLVGYPESSGATIYEMNLNTYVCTTLTPTGSPTSGTNPDGLFGRLGWFPTLQEALLVNDWNVDAFVLNFNATQVSPATLPSVAVTSPVSSATVSGTTSVTATASDGAGITGVQFNLDGTALGTKQVTPPYSVSWNTLLTTNGSHAITAVATDAAGNMSTSAAVSVTVANAVAPPTVSITTPTTGATVSGTLSVGAYASSSAGIAKVQFNLDGASLGAAVSASPYTTSWNTATATNRSHTLTAVATDTVGNVTSSSGVTVTVSNTVAPTSPTTSTYNGLGNSTLTCLDVDGDGYGVGPGCAGPDADDNDPTVQTAAQAIAKYGTLSSFLVHLGYTPNRIWYLDPAGHDASGIVNSASSPFLTYGAINGLVAAGDMVMLRNGWNGRITPPSGSSGNPIVIMSYPGEQAVLDATNGQGETITIQSTSWLTVDGVKFRAGACMNGGTVGMAYGNGSSVSTFHNNIFRHIDAGEGGCGLAGLFAANGLLNITVEYSVFHDNDCGGGSCQHGIYFGSNDVVSSNVTIHRNLFFNNAWNGIHFNGRVTNLIVEQNVIYNVGVAGISFQNGVSSSFVRANVIFNGGGKGVDIDNYESGQCYGILPGSGVNPICPYDQTNNLFENNTFYMTAFLADPLDSGTAVTGAPAVQVTNITTGCGTYTCTPAVHVGNLGGNTFRNNVIVAEGDLGPNVTYPPILYPTCQAGTGGPGQPGCVFDSSNTYLSTSTFDHNVFYQADGVGGTGVIGYGPSAAYGWAPYTCATAAAITNMIACTFANPQFLSASPSFWNTPSQFNFRLQPSSLGVHTGNATGEPAYDLTGTAFASTPSVGAYEIAGSTTTTTSCDLNNDGVVNILDVQIAINQALGLTPCTNADLQQIGQCNTTDVQTVLNASLGGACVVSQ